MPSKAQARALTVSSEETERPIGDNYYTATANVYVDDTLYGSVNVAHGSAQTTYTCDFGQTVTGTTVKVVFSRNTYYWGRGRYWGDPYDRYFYSFHWDVYITEINFR